MVSDMLKAPFKQMKDYASVITFETGISTTWFADTIDDLISMGNRQSGFLGEIKSFIFYKKTKKSSIKEDFKLYERIT